jgi:hypothetical protein
VINRRKIKPAKSGSDELLFSHMWRTAFVSAILLIGFSLGSSRQKVLNRQVPCKTAKLAASCYWAHGRLGYGNGTPAVRLWKIGTNRVLGIFSGPSVDRGGLDNENPDLPANIYGKLKPLENWIYADFEVCPLEPEQKGAMQAACIESAKNVVITK